MAIGKLRSHIEIFIKLHSFHVGTVQYIRMPFGLTNTAAIYQRAIDIALTKFKWKTYIVYMNDVIIY